MLNAIYLIQIYKIAKEWFDIPLITVFMCIIGTVVVVKKRKKIIGFAVRTGKYLHYIAVSKEYQGQGYGHKLFKKMFPKIDSLTVKVKLRRSIQFYKRYGFKIKRSEPWITGKRYLMVKA
jgi:ribosomal protein S18 acetylase RimI-like enzyme